MPCDFLITLTPGLNFDAICLCFNAVLAMGHLQRWELANNDVNNALVAFSSFSERLPSLTINRITHEERLINFCVLLGQNGQKVQEMNLL